MHYEFDIYGWYVATHNEPQPRTTPLVPPNLETSTVDGTIRSMFTGYSWQEMAYIGPGPTVPGPVHADGKITRLAFRNRFTHPEKIAIELASIDNPAATSDARQLAASLRVSLADQRDATYIDLNRTDTRTGVEVLETYGLLSAGRAAAILDTEIQDEERPVTPS